MRQFPGPWVVLVAAGAALGAAEPVVGHWFWVDHQTLAFRADGSVAALKAPAPARDGRWTVLNAGERKYRVKWTRDGAEEDFQVSADGWTLASSNPDGVPQRGERLDEDGR
jgi:hypothetical protein